MVRTAKGKANGLLLKFKSRLVAKGFRQRFGLDYDSTYAAVAMMSTIKMLLSVAAHFNMVTFQFDVEGAFLLPDLEHEIYISWKGNTTSVTSASTDSSRVHIGGLKSLVQSCAT